MYEDTSIDSMGVVGRRVVFRNEEKLNWGCLHM